MPRDPWARARSHGRRNPTADHTAPPWSEVKEGRVGKEDGETNIVLPEHCERFPCMEPWIGTRYRDHRHKRLLVVGESDYLPNESAIHHDPERWYGSSQECLSEKEIAWASTVGNITGPWYRAYRIYREIRDEIAAVLRESGITPDDFALNHVATVTTSCGQRRWPAVAWRATSAARTPKWPSTC